MASNPFLKVTWQEQEITASVRQVEVEDHDRLIDEARITMQDPGGAGAAVMQEGQTVEIDLGWEDEHAVLFKGTVVNPTGEATRNGSQLVTVVARDPSHAMNREPHTETYGAGKLSAHIATVMARHPAIPVGQVAPDPDPEFKAETPLRQHNRTDLQFLQALAELYGARAFVEVNDGTAKFYFVSNKRLAKAESLGRLQYCRGLRQLVDFRYQRIASRAARQVVAVTVDPVTGEVRRTEGERPEGLPAVTASQDRAAELGAADPSARAVYEAAAESGARSTPPEPARARSSATPSDPAHVERLTIADPTRILGLRGEGRAVGTVKLRAKGKVTIEGLAPWAEGDWYVAKAVHAWRDTSTPGRRGSSYETRFTATR